MAKRRKPYSKIQKTAITNLIAPVQTRTPSLIYLCARINKVLHEVRFLMSEFTGISYFCYISLTVDSG